MSLERDALEARALLDNELLARVLASIEQEAINRGVTAKPADDAGRLSAMADVRAARSLKAKLASLVAEQEVIAGRKGKPA